MTWKNLTVSSSVFAIALCLVTASAGHAQIIQDAQTIRKGQIIGPSQTEIKTNPVGVIGNAGIVSSQIRFDDYRRFQRLGTYEINVPSGKIFAAELGADDIDYWFVDSATGDASAKQTLTAKPGPAYTGQDNRYKCLARLLL